VSLEADRRRVRQGNAALVLGLFRRLVVRVAQVASARVQTPKPRWSVRRYHQRCAQHDGGPERLQAWVSAKSPTSWRLQK